MSGLPSVDRRTLLIGGGVGIGLVVGLSLWRRGLSTGLDAGTDEQTLGAFIKIARSGRVTVAVPQVETGQGIWTALPQIVADQLGAAWDSIAVEPAPLTSAYRNRLASAGGWFDGLGPLRAFRLDRGEGSILTAGATSVRAFAEPMREAAAAARAMLIGAAADRWDIHTSDCEAADGLVLNGGRSFTFGELAEEAAQRSPPRNPPIRPGRLVGRTLPRLDGPAKTNGKLRFAGDVRLPDMLYASVRLAPAGGRLTGFDRAALDRPGVRHVAARDEWIAVVADRWSAAEQAVHAANPRFAAPAAWADPRAGYQAALDRGEFAIAVDSGDFGKAAASKRPVAATYWVAPALHRTLEPQSATARWLDGAPELWLGSQAPGLGATDATLFPLPVGGPDGRALENPLAPVALALARTMNRPVQVTLAPGAGQFVTPTGPGLLARMSAVSRADGLPLGWHMQAATANGLTAAIDRLAGGAPTAEWGKPAQRGSTPPYGIEDVLIEMANAAPPTATGYVRGSPDREYCFATESFVDELARQRGMEPLAFRMAMLGGNPRLARCLQSAAALAGWDGGDKGSNMGIAGAMAFGSAIALVATASINSAQRVQAHKLVATVDCGPVINPGLATQQVEAALLWALDQAGGETGLNATPEIIVNFLPSKAPWGGLSGLGAIPLAPAIANAIHAATGKRMRALPFDPMAV